VARSSRETVRGEGLLKSRIPLPQAACLVGGTLFGAIFGDRVFPEIEAMFGHPGTDIFFGLICAFFAVFAYEMVAMFFRSD
jgi:hypothetical protein